VSARALNRAVARGRKRALELEQRLELVLSPILQRAGDDAAAAFRDSATDFLTAAGSRELRRRDALAAVAFPAKDRRGLLSSLALTAAAPSGASTMVAVKPRADEAAALATPGGDPAEVLHVTLAYLGETEEADVQAVADALRAVAATHAPLAGEVGGLARFAENDEGAAPAVLLPDVPGLVELRVAVTEALVAAGVGFSRDHGFTPHLTITYFDPADPDPEGVPEAGLIGLPLHFDALVVARGDVPVEIPLVGAPPVTASAVLSDKGREIADVADSLDAAKPDYGDTAWHPETGTVRWVPADYTEYPAGYDEAEAAFLAVDGVERFEATDAEACLDAPESDGWEVVYGGDCAGLSAAGRKQPGQGDPPPRWAAPLPDEVLNVAALAAVLAAKSAPVREAFLKAVMSYALEQAGLSFDITNPFVAKMLAKTGEHIASIARTTQEDVMRVIAASYEAGLSIPDTAAAIRSAMAEASPARAQAIARTEMAGAVNGGSLAAAQIVAAAGGGVATKRWMTAATATSTSAATSWSTPATRTGRPRRSSTAGAPSRTAKAATAARTSPRRGSACAGCWPRYRRLTYQGGT
jgi:hypothetical protein